MVDQLIKGNILVLSHPIQHFENLIENGELLLLGLLLQPLEELLLAEIEQLCLGLADFVASCIDVGDDFVGVEAHGECLLVEVCEQPVEYFEEVVGVQAGVVQHLVGERSLPPVCELVGLVSGDVAVVVEEVGVGEAGEAEHSRCPVGVKEVEDVDVEVPLQPPGVHLRPVHHLNDALVLHDLLEQRHLPPNREHVDNIVPAPCGYLDQARHALVALAGVLHIHCDLGLARELVDHRLELRRRADVAGLVVEGLRFGQAQLSPDELEVLLVVVEVEGGGFDVGMQVLWPLGLAGLLGWPFLFALAVFVRLPVPLHRSFDIVSDRFEDVEAVVDDGGERRFLEADELAKGVDGVFDGIL